MADSYAVVVHSDGEGKPAAAVGPFQSEADADTGVSQLEASAEKEGGPVGFSYLVVPMLTTEEWVSPPSD